MPVRPMLAAQKYREAGDLWGPSHEAIVARHIKEDGYMIVQPKWDGFRMIHWDEIPMSRSGKPLANSMLQKFVREHPEFHGLDGEVFPGHNYHPEVFRTGMSQIRSGGGDGDIMIAAYDFVSEGRFGYQARRSHLQAAFDLHEERPVVIEGDGYNVHILLCPQIEVRSLEELYAEEARLVALKFEGAITRRPHALYKYNRATALGGELTKVKRRETYDAIVTGYEERLQNANEAKTSELGFTVRSAHQANLVPTGMLGALLIQFVNGPFKGVAQKCGVFRGLGHGDLKALWDERETLGGRYCEVSVDPADGGYDSARCPVWVKWRPASEF
jgi:ATP-dependent DNA ligase